MAFRCVLLLWALEYIPHTAQDVLSSSGCRWKAGFHEYIPSTVILCHRLGAAMNPYPMSLSGLLETGGAARAARVWPPFHHGLPESQARQFSALFSSSSVLLPSIWAIVRSSFVCLLCPLVQLFSCLRGHSCLGLERLSGSLGGQRPPGLASPSLSVTAVRKGHGGNPEVAYPKAMHRHHVLALRKNRCFKE